MANYSTPLQRVEYGLETIPADRTVIVSLRDLMYIHQTLAEFVQFFHQPMHYPNLNAVEEFLGTRNSGYAIDVLFEAQYRRIRDMIPSDIDDAFAEGSFEHPLPPEYFTYIKKEFPGAVPEIPVRQIDEAVEYYQTKLDFTLDWGSEELGLAGLSKGNCRIFLSNPTYRKQFANSGPVLTWINLDSREEVDGLYREWSEHGAKVVSKAESKPWGLHEFLVEDLDGNLFRVFYDFRTPERTEDA